ncbi:SVBP protein, partial [Pachyramphus minor]|nr:SVBP protein [Pachyramphus minor]
GGRKSSPTRARPPFSIPSFPSLLFHPSLSQSQIYALNRVMTELEQQQFDSFCKQMQGGGE